MRIVCYLSLLSILLLAGCRQNQSTTPSTSDTAPAAPKPLAEEIELDVASWEEIQQHIAGQKGKVIVLDMWATW